MSSIDDNWLEEPRSRRLPWFDSRTDFEKDRDSYLEAIRDLAARVDDIEQEAGVDTGLLPCMYQSGFTYVRDKLARLSRLIGDDDQDDLLADLEDIAEDLRDYQDDAILHDNLCDTTVADPYDQHDDDIDPADDIDWLDDDWDDL